MFSTLLSNFNLLSKIIPRYLYFSTLSTISPSIVIGETAGGMSSLHLVNSSCLAVSVVMNTDVLVLKICGSQRVISATLFATSICSKGVVLFEVCCRFVNNSEHLQM